MIWNMLLTHCQFKKNLFLTSKLFFIIDDLLATGGTVDCVVDIINSQRKEITGLSVVIELEALNAKSKFNFLVESQLIY